MKLGTKIAGGFGLLLVIAISLGGIAVYLMSNVKTESTKLADEYVPEMKLAAEMSNEAWETMYNMRGYSLTGNPQMLKQGTEKLGHLKEGIEEGKKLAERAKNLTALRGQIDSIETNVTAYSDQKDETVALTAAMDTNRETLNDSATAYMDNSADFLKGQNAAFKKDLDERLQKIELVTEIVNIGTQTRVLNFKGQALNDTGMIQQAIETLEESHVKTAELRKITRDDADIKRIDVTEAAAKQYAEAMGHFIKEFAKGSNADPAVLAAERKEMDASAGRYVTNSHEFFEAQRAALKHDMLQRNQKINIVNDIIDLGNATRVDAFKSQALRDPEVMQAALGNFEEMDKLFAALHEITFMKEDKDRIEGTKTAASGYKKGMTNFLANWNKMQELNKRRGTTADEVLKATATLTNAATDAGTDIANGARESLGFANTVMVVGLLIALVIGVVLAYVITVSITKPINRIIAGLTEGASQVSSASGQISSASQQLAEGATEQAASLEESSSALEEMASMTRQNADNAQSANNQMSGTQQQVQEGAVAVKNMAGAMGEINQSSEEISKIIKTIEEIAFQTNLLALNAAVEAARAGDAGKGFAVVADEVRNLAQRSAQAARDTAELIEGTVTRVKNGTAIVEELEKSFSEVEASAGQVASLVAEISAASNEQAQGVDQVNTAVAQMDKVTQSNAANAEQSASASEEMSAQAEQLNEMVSQLMALVGGAQGASGSPAQRPALGGGRKAPTARQLAGPGGSHGKAPSSSDGAKVVKPNDVIPLDDDDFSEF